MAGNTATTPALRHGHALTHTPAMHTHPPVLSVLLPGHRTACLCPLSVPAVQRAWDTAWGAPALHLSPQVHGSSHPLWPPEQVHRASHPPWHASEHLGSLGMPFWADAPPCPQLGGGVQPVHPRFSQVSPGPGTSAPIDPAPTPCGGRGCLRKGPRPAQRR